MDGSDRGSSRRRGGFNHWIPLAITLTIATAGVAAWVWSQRNQDDDYEDDLDDEDLRRSDDFDYAARSNYGESASYHDAATASRNVGAVAGSAANDSGSSVVGNTIRLTNEDAASAIGGPNAAGWGTRSPQQWVGHASKAVTAGVAAASAAVGGALASIREGDKEAYGDHEAWSQEAEQQLRRTGGNTKAREATTTTTTTTTTASKGASATSRDIAAATGATASSGSYAKDGSNRKRKAIAIVVSADSAGAGDPSGFHEHASILSYIPRQTEFSKTRIFVLIYAPDLKDSSSLEATSNLPPNSLSSSYSNIGPEQAQSPRDEIKNPLSTPASSAFNAVNAQALALVEKESDIIPFTSANGHAHILHLLEPDVVYLQESLTGDNGAIVNQLQNWMRNEIVVVVGAESGYGGLADSESEAEKPSAASKVVKWWQKEERVGRGRGVVVVDGLRVNDDWVRRVLDRS